MSQFAVRAPHVFAVALCTLLLACPGEEPVPEPATPAPVNAWNEGPYGVAVRDVARDFDITVVTPGVDPDEEWTFEFRDAWNGEDSFVFLQNINNNTQPFWESSLVDLLTGACRSGTCSPASVPNVHYFFVSARGSWESDYDSMSERIRDALRTIDDMPDLEYSRDHWRERLHVATQMREDIGGLVDEILVTWPGGDSPSGGWSALGFGIDRFQRLREIGLTRFVGDGFQNEMWFAANMPRHYNYEYDRAIFLRDNPADAVVPLWQEEQLGGGGRFAEVVLPDPRANGYDTLEIDLTIGCPDGGADKGCWEWDYKAHMQICEAEIDIQEPPETCTYAFEDRIAGINIEADTFACTCTSPYDGTIARERTCNAVEDEEGNVTGQWGACPCACGSEIARWITSYHRHGRWLTDITPSLAFLQGGGPARLKFQTSYPYTMTAALRYPARGTDTAPRPAMPRGGGGGCGGGYNAGHAPIEFEIPPDATGAEVMAFITGHGFGSGQNCAEFCPHNHHFSVNGGEVHTQAYPEADDWLGCIPQIDDGALPNQYGTWYLGRGGWCPGLDVPPFRADVTADLDFGGGPNVISYEASLYGNPPANNGNIWMSSYLVFYR